MASQSCHQVQLCFGPYIIDLRAGELRKNGIRIRLSGQPYQILLYLLAHPGDIVTREELRIHIWGNGTFVDFEHSLNAAVNRLRRALNDSAESPRFIETIPGRGYKFIESLQALAGPEMETAALPPPIIAEPSRKWPYLLAGLVSIAGLLFYLHRPRPLPVTGAIVLADFSNRTKDPVFDGTLRQGLAIQLEQSPYLSLVSDERIQRTLALMNQAAQAPLTAERGREVCERTGSAAVLDGSIASLGSQYVLTLNAKNCTTGEAIFREQAQAARKEDVPAVLSRMATRFRSRAGETLSAIENHSVPLREATTPSLEALKAYTTGMQVAFSSGFASAVPHLKRAIELDPQFATAYAYLGRLYADTGQPDLAADATRRAFDLRQRANARERFFITFSYDRQITGNLQNAQQTLDLWIQTYSRDGSPHSLLSGLTTLATAQYERCIREAQTAIYLNPEGTPAYANLAGCNLCLDRLPEAEAAVRLAAERKLEIDDFLILRYNLAFLKNDDAAMEREVAHARGKRGAEDWMDHQQALVMARSGHLRKARAMSRRAVELALENGERERAALYRTGQAVYEAVLGDARATKVSARAALAFSNDRDVEYGNAFALAIAGDASGSRALASGLDKRFPEDTLVRFQYLPVLRALSALARGENAKAAEFLEDPSFDFASPATAFLGGFGALYPVYARGQTYLAAHRGADAAAEFQKVITHRGLLISDPIGARAHLQLGRAFAMSRDNAKAKAAYKQFLDLWQDADLDISILKQAKSEYAGLR
jgi:DNA-binding winged helix-turn-helix (wHTH) protein/DNA-binding SARP family transcriptional activator